MADTYTATMSTDDAQEIFNWIAWLLFRGDYVPRIVLDMSESIGKELGLGKEDGDDK